MSRPLMLDLFAGLGGASADFRANGWDVVTVELDAKFSPDVIADVRTWRWSGRAPTLIWASPPCTEFSRERMPWCRTGNAPSLELVRAAMSVIVSATPRYWIVENVRGSVPYLDSMFGRFTSRCGPFFLYGNAPRVSVDVAPFKERLSSKRKAERAKLPLEVSRAVRLAIEATL